MLVDFIVKNYGPFKNEAILTMTASKRNEHPENFVETKAVGNILTSVAVFGPNATGKTYLIEALSVLRNLVSAPAMPNAPIMGYNPFRLSKDTKDAPVEMKIRFTIEDILYDYYISFDDKRILNEKLYYFPNGRRSSVFNRNRDTFTIGRASGNWLAVSRMVPPNSTFVYTAAQFNNDICRRVHNWFLNDLIILAYSDENKLIEVLINRMNQDPELKKRAVNAMKVADFAISDIQGTVRKRKIQDIQGMPPQMKGFMMALGNEETNETEVFLIHDVNGDDITKDDKRFPLVLESAGTVRFLSIIGPILDTLTYGKILIIDEFGQRLHNMVSKWVVSMFSDKMQNRGGGQLIFNTHSTHLMDQQIFRRDQIYLVSKNDRGESELFSISDFGERKDRAILNSYLDGKYGAIPFIEEGTLL